jgi:hypothetical protein
MNPLLIVASALLGQIFALVVLAFVFRSRLLSVKSRNTAVRHTSPCPHYCGHAYCKRVYVGRLSAPSIYFGFDSYCSPSGFLFLLNRAPPP